MSDSSQATEQPDPDAPGSTADYDPEQDQDTEPSNMAPAGERPTDQPAGD